jgi:hypothetical protein
MTPSERRSSCLCPATWAQSRSPAPENSPPCTLESTELHQYSADALSRTLLRAIQDAEAQAQRRRADTIAAAVAETGLA